MGKLRPIKRIAESAGFTLIEILVAMAILMVIVLMMATLFHSSTNAWDNGMRQAEISLEARAVMNMIQRDLSQAVADSQFPCQFNQNSVEFYRPDSNITSNRAMVRIKYRYNSGALVREEQIFAPSPVGSYWVSVSNRSATLLQDMDNMEFYWTAGPYTTNLPRWVDIVMEINQQSIGSASIKVFSMGADEQSDTDDIQTWRP